jgi:hypothetical protein
MIINEITSNINQNIHIFNTSITSPIINTISQIITSKTIQLFFGLILIVFIGLYLKKRYKQNCDGVKNNYYRDKDEILSGVNYYLYHPSKIRYLFWTGGYDSTFLLIQALLVEGYPIQPIYIKCQNLDTKFGIKGRENQDKEIETMKLLRRRIIIDFPHVKPMFLPTLYVYSIKKDLNITNSFRKIHQQFGFFSRDVTQYERMAIFSIHFNKPIEVGLEKCGTGLDFATQGIRNYEGTKECQILSLSELETLNTLNNDTLNNDTLNNDTNNTYGHFKKDYKLLTIFRNFRFPIVHMTKEDVKQFSARQKLLYILQMTWICWHPTIEGTPCNTCPQCLKRINLDNFR